MMIAKRAMELAICKAQLQMSDNFATSIGLFHKAIGIEALIYRIQHTPAIIFKLNGKIDKRRYRRYVTKHKKLIKLYPVTKESVQVKSLNGVINDFI